MIAVSIMTLDELSCLGLALQDTMRDHADLDLPLLEEMFEQVTAEREKRK